MFYVFHPNLCTVRGAFSRVGLFAKGSKYPDAGTTVKTTNRICRSIEPAGSCRPPAGRGGKPFRVGGGFGNAGSEGDRVAGPKKGGRIIGADPLVSNSCLRCAVVIAALAALAFVAAPMCAGQSGMLPAMAALPDAPEPQTPAASPTPKLKPCPPPGSFHPTPPDAGAKSAVAQVGQPADSGPCKVTWANRYDKFVNGPQDKPLTPKDKAWLAVRNVADPFNNVTILGEAAISVASDSHSVYGPGMAGYGRYVGVSYTQDLIGEFFGTFLIPSIAHQDPHYHRMPNAGIYRRIEHATLQVLWTQGDNGKGMVNYSNVAGFAVDEAISNLYVPGRKTTPGAAASRYATGIATAPIGNYITEFVPDVARHIHVQIVIIQRIINQVARSEGGEQ